jgi:hypothetical protein
VSEELVPVLLWVEVDPVRVSVIFLFLCGIRSLALIPVFLALARSVVGIPFGNTTSWLILEGPDVNGLEKVTLLPEWDLWASTEHIVH